MNLLFPGGTVFVGRHLVTSTLDAGHAVLLFNRGLPVQGHFPAWNV